MLLPLTVPLLFPLESPLKLVLSVSDPAGLQLLLLDVCEAGLLNALSRAVAATLVHIGLARMANFDFLFLRSLLLFVNPVIERVVRP